MNNGYELLGFLAAILYAVSLIVFFVMASNISSIKSKLSALSQQLDPYNYNDSYIAGQVNERQGKTKDAIDCYIESYFFADRQSKRSPKSQDWNKIKETLNEKIVSLGGSKQV